MSNGMNLPVVIGLAVGIGFIALMVIMFYGSSGNDIGKGRYEFDFKNAESLPPVTGDLPRITISNIRIVDGASLASNPEFMVPQVATVGIGVNNTVRWINEDSVPHAIVSDNDYRDPVSGPFNTFEQQQSLPGGFLKEGQTFDFTFTEPGRYDYHHEPHPHIQGTIIVLEMQ